uniref:30.5 kDa salivary protein n=1 Tax=Phlebotomus ariasi TaxID=59272 RepID=Q2TLW7_9DIPT|nr:30.5 kDa salivary protein [Phlebotomus ariasi]
MFKEIIVVALAVIVAQCAPPAIPIAKQGNDFPVPIVDEKETDDFFDDRFYPDIDDERVGARAPVGGKQTSNRGTSSQSDKVPRPQGSNRGPSSQTTDKVPRPQWPSRGTNSQNDKVPRPQGSSGQTPPRTPGKVEQSGRTNTKDQIPRPLTNRNPTKNPTEQARRPGNRELLIRDKTPGSQGGKQGTGNRQKLSSYKDAQPKLIFKSSQFNTDGQNPYLTRLFKTKKVEEVIAKGSPTDEYVLELLDGKPDNLSLVIRTNGKTSQAVLRNPTRNRIVGRIKSYNPGPRRMSY